MWWSEYAYPMIHMTHIQDSNPFRSFGANWAAQTFADWRCPATKQVFVASSADLELRSAASCGKSSSFLMISNFLEENYPEITYIYICLHILLYITIIWYYNMNILCMYPYIMPSTCLTQILMTLLQEHKTDKSWILLPCLSCLRCPPYNFLSHIWESTCSLRWVSHLISTSSKGASK